MAEPTMTGEAARRRMDAMISDKGFGDRLKGGDAAALAEWDSVNRAIAGAPAVASPARTPQEAARAEIERLSGDPVFYERLKAGDPAAREEWNRTNEALARGAAA